MSDTVTPVSIIPDPVTTEFHKEIGRNRWNMRVHWGECVLGALDAAYVAEQLSAIVYSRLMSNYAEGKRFDGSALHQKSQFWLKRPKRKPDTQKDRERVYRYFLVGELPRKPKKPKPVRKSNKKISSSREYTSVMAGNFAMQEYQEAMIRYRRNMIKQRLLKRRYTIAGNMMMPDADRPTGQDSGLLINNIKIGKAGMPQKMQVNGQLVNCTSAIIRITTPRNRQNAIWALKLFQGEGEQEIIKAICEQELYNIIQETCKGTKPAPITGTGSTGGGSSSGGGSRGGTRGGLYQEVKWIMAGRAILRAAQMLFRLV